MERQALNGCGPITRNGNGNGNGHGTSNGAASGLNGEGAHGVRDAALEELCQGLLYALGEDPSRPGLVRTSERFAKAMRELTRGYDESLDDIVNGALFEEPYREMVLVKNVELFSLCEHHVLPFFGKVHVAYVPDGKLIGLSKIPRIVRMFSRRLQIQERLTTDIAAAIEAVLQPLGVACYIEASHLCMMMRVVESSGSLVTTAMTGCFETDPNRREEFLRLVQAPEPIGEFSARP